MIADLDRLEKFAREAKENKTWGDLIPIHHDEILKLIAQVRKMAEALEHYSTLQGYDSYNEESIDEGEKARAALADWKNE